MDKERITIADPGMGDFYTMRRKDFEMAWKDEDGLKSFMVIIPR